MNAEQYAQEWAVKTHKSTREIYIPEALRSKRAEQSETERKILRLVDDIREDGTESGVLYFPDATGSSAPGDTLTVGLARFQSYRGRTTAALVEELTDFIGTGNTLLYDVDTENSVVLLEVR